MMLPSKHLRLPATAPENVPLIARMSAQWQVHFLCTHCTSVFFFLFVFFKASLCLLICNGLIYLRVNRLDIITRTPEQSNKYSLNFWEVFLFSVWIYTRWERDYTAWQRPPEYCQNILFVSNDFIESVTVKMSSLGHQCMCGVGTTTGHHVPI